MMERKCNLVFILGGARSGKSGFALERASACPGKKVYIATAQALDEEMKERIEKHQKERSSEWSCIEKPLQITGVIKSISDKCDVILLDCLTLWLSSMMLTDKNIESEIASFIDTLRNTHHTSHIFIVSNEVGSGIVPDNELSRRFRDWAGYLNQKVAKAADEVYLVTAGIPLKIK
ncbi:MAG: bifunctional adenosylcobinamide kinase/adenosylcobinamide-phosphate guanylyltransferase [Thermodesulfovibrionales bacterium]|nr:bifunctional adenosylcobinamide kinase/adenosylcobinamide-phosphate guanylyltransferase [Thermodesulfovibrionales bacterium]